MAYFDGVISDLIISKTLSNFDLIICRNNENF